MNDDTQRRSRFGIRQWTSILSFTLVFCLLFGLVERLFFDESISSTTWKTIREKQTVPEILIMGNSHAYCSFIPDLLNGALAVDSAVLAVTGQDAMGITDNWEAVLEVGKPKLVIAELNAFYFEPGIMAKDNKAAALDNLNAMPSLGKRVQSAFRELGLEDVPQGAFQLLRADHIWSRWNRLFEAEYVNRYEHEDVLGYHQLDYFAQGTYQSAAIPVTFDAERAISDDNTEAWRQLRRFLTLARENNVEVWLVKSPVASRWVGHPNGSDVARKIAEDFEDVVAYCYDFGDNLPELAYTAADFYDGGHLNRRGAVKFTRLFGEVMAQRLGIEPDWTKPFGYRDEQISAISADQWRYVMEASGHEVLYRFEVEDEAGGKALLQDWSEENSVLCNIPPEEANRVVVTICPKELLENQETNAMTLRFMVANECVLDL
ncbi:MAG: hypothetical protein PHI98_13600 [Eubacteriales bacterium]|nr:hypothetical protein [Eubacteriales bacterium]